MSSKYNYNRTGAERKALVEAVSQMLDQSARYLGAPTFAYTVGAYNIDKNGTLSCNNDTQPEAFKTLVEALRERGFSAENVVDEATRAVAGNSVETAIAVSDGSSEDNTLTIEVPKTGFNDISLDNLHKIIASKEALLKKALGTDRLLIADTGDTLKFPWFTLYGLEGEVDAYSRLIAAICSMARKQKRVTAKEHGAGNDKFDMRLFLVRLGFVGDEYKAARKILLRNLTGNSSWKSGHAPARTAPDTEAAGSVSQPETEGGGSYGK